MFSQIPKEKLKVGAFYLGRGRNGNIGLWDGSLFLVLHQERIRKTNSSGDIIGFTLFPHIKSETYFTNESGCFQPFREIDEGRLVNECGVEETSWYGEYLVLEKTNKRFNTDA